MTELPAFNSLPEGKHGGRLGWHQFGEKDDIGTVNLLTPERIAAAARLVRKGIAFPLNAPLDLFNPTLTASRGVARHRVLTTNLELFTGMDDVYDNVYPQVSSQWDSLAHASYSPGVFYNGVTAAEITGGHRNTINHWAERGIVGRGVVLDMTTAISPYDPGSTIAFSVADLERARDQAGITLETGDILIIHTGFAAWYRDLPVEQKQVLPKLLQMPGLEHSEEMCSYLWNVHAAAVVSDNLAVEVWPPDTNPHAAPYGFLHQMLIGSLGLALGELWWLADLVADCRDDGVYEAMLVSAPINQPGGIGSPANAIALK